MKLNLPQYQFKTRVNSLRKDEIFDEFRKKFILLTPEEWVRQNFIKFLIEEKKYPSMLIAIEKGIKVNNMQKRFDAVVYNRNGQPVMLLEFKSHGIKISQKVMEQISRYNLNLNVSYLLVSNGLVHYCCYINKETGDITFLNDVPDFNDLGAKEI
ncbi:MAG: type I restriction enzyme HsdR N-terminal domain-containing protein [Bacteroidetes bacterium]|nr:type I restriction enzyme HsdR N-terminal domain-containing protein [Bacteroidota bacterium]